jgi:DNA repair photolyase
LTRGTIELLSKYPKYTISILTKNALVLRDIDLLAGMSGRVDVGFTITTFSERAQQIFEPHAPPVKNRIEAIRQLEKMGVKTWAFIAPILPYVTEIELESGLHQLADAGVKKIMTDRYNARGLIIAQTLEAYRSWDPNSDLERIRPLLWKENEYYHLLDEKIFSLWKKIVPAGNYERDLDWYFHKKETGKRSTSSKQGSTLPAP